MTAERVPEKNGKIEGVWLQRSAGPRTVAMSPVPFFPEVVEGMGGDVLRIVDRDVSVTRALSILAAFALLLFLLGIAFIVYELAFNSPPSLAVPVVFAASWFVVFAGCAVSAMRGRAAMAILIIDVAKKMLSVEIRTSTDAAAIRASSDIAEANLAVHECELKSGVGRGVFRGYAAVLRIGSEWMVLACSREKEPLDKWILQRLPCLAEARSCGSQEVLRGYAFLRWNA